MKAGGYRPKEKEQKLPRGKVIRGEIETPKTFRDAERGGGAKKVCSRKEDGSGYLEAHSKGLRRTLANRGGKKQPPS